MPMTESGRQWQAGLEYAMTPVSACPTQITPDPGLSTLREKKTFSSPKEYLPPSQPRPDNVKVVFIAK